MVGIDLLHARTNGGAVGVMGMAYFGVDEPGLADGSAGNERQVRAATIERGHGKLMGQLTLVGIQPTVVGIGMEPTALQP